MKSWMKWIIAGILVLALAACGNDTDDKPKTEPVTGETGEKEDDKKKDEITADEIIKKALAVTDDQKSMHIAMDVDHTVSVPENDFTSNTKMTIESDFVAEPFMLYQLTKTNMADEQVDFDLYATDDVFYLYNIEDDFWVEMPEADKDDIIGDFDEELDQFLFLELFQEFADEFTVEETDAAYLIKLNSSGDQFNSILEDLIVDEIVAEFDEDEDIEIKNFNAKNVTLDFSIAKETFFINSFNMDLDTSLELDGVEMVFAQKTKALISKLNEIDTIEIPQEVIDNAIKLDDLE